MGSPQPGGSMLCEVFLDPSDDLCLLEVGFSLYYYSKWYFVNAAQQLFQFKWKIHPPQGHLPLSKCWERSYCELCEGVRRLLGNSSSLDVITQVAFLFKGSNFYDSFALVVMVPRTMIIDQATTEAGLAREIKTGNVVLVTNVSFYLLHQAGLDLMRFY